MSRAISMDLRERAMARLDEGQTVRKVAEALSVAPSSVVKWSQRRRATGSCAPGKPGGRRPRKIVGDHEAWLLKRLGTAFTLRGLVDELAARGLEVDCRTVWNAVHRAGYSFKKKPCTPPSNCERTSPAAGSAGSATRNELTRAAWSSLTRPGQRPTWRRCAAGRQGASA